MYNTNVIIRALIGPGYGCIRVFTTCIDVMARLLFEQGIPMDDVSVTKDVYSQAAKLLHMKSGAVARNAERMACLCRTMSSLQRLEQVIGRSIKEIPQVPTSATVMCYLAFYSRLEVPFYEAIESHPEILFQQSIKI